MMHRPLTIVALAALALSGCVAKTAATVVTAPVRLASGAVDLATTSQSERDEKRGRELRETQEKLRDLEKDRARQQKRCDAGDARACDRVASIDRQMADLRARLQF
jgi:Spy/CpxP family protein refolding chaperone